MAYRRQRRNGAPDFKPATRSDIQSWAVAIFLIGVLLSLIGFVVQLLLSP